ncbi:MAG: GNAT family N-acetyltransferase [Bdellovibrionales bacterium]
MALAYKWVEKDEFEAVYKAIATKAFDLGNYFIELEPALTARERQKRKKASTRAHPLSLVVYDKKKPVAFCHSTIGDTGDMFMRLSVVLRAYRRKGIYANMLKRMVARAREEGCVKIISNHQVTNNGILIAKLQQGFTIGGMQLAPDVGLLVQLVYFTNPTVDKIHRFRVGAAKLDRRTAKKLKTNPLR